jgi:hypothetical protein
MPENKYKVKTKPKKGQPLSAAQKQSVEQGTFERKVQPVGYKVKQRNASGVGATSKATREKLISKPISKESNYRGTKSSEKTVRAKGAGTLAGHCISGTKKCKTAYGKYSR